MKSYLSLVGEYAKVHKKKNRLTVLCIAISVMLVTAIFGMADMSVKAQIDEFIRQNGNYHAIVGTIDEDTAQQIKNRRDINISGFLSMAEDTSFEGKPLYVQGGEQAMVEQMNLRVTEGRYPDSIQEALIDEQALEQMGIAIGDTIEVSFSDEQTRRYTITGTYSSFSNLKAVDAHGLYLTKAGIAALPDGMFEEYYYLQFKSGVNINKAISEIKTDHGLSDEQVSANVRLLGLMGQSDDSSMLGIYATALVLFVLVVLVGVFMIASSFNMSILERTQFFGLLRCLGATKKQIKRYIRLEGLQYCLKGIPLGLLSGCGVMWLAIVFLNALSIQEFPPMRLLQVSWPGIAAGTVLGVLVVMIASSAPAKNAARVSPQAAVTGNINHTNNVKFRKASNTNLFHVDTAMGLRHAFSNKKSMVLIGGSFAVSIVTFLCFSVLVTFMNHALNPLKPYAPDLSILGVQDTVLIDRSLAEELRGIPNVKKVYGRMFYQNIPASDGQTSGTAVLISYDESQFEWAQDMLVEGSVEQVKNGGGVLVEYTEAEQFGWSVGDILDLTLAEQPCRLQIAGIVSDIPFYSGNGGWNIVASEETFSALTGITGYTILDMQLNQNVSGQVRELISPEMQLLDKQERNNEVQTGYYAMAVFVYGFLLVIALVAVINIINTVNASVSSRISNYGMMRAVGMSGKQLKRMVTTEAAAYAMAGSLAGAVFGLYLHRFSFEMLITSNWGEGWQPPLALLATVLLVGIFTTFIAVILPTKKIEKMTILHVVNAN